MKRQFGGWFGVLRSLPSPAATRQCPRRPPAVRQPAEHTVKGKNTVNVALALLLHLKLRGGKRQPRRSPAPSSWTNLHLSRRIRDVVGILGSCSTCGMIIQCFIIEEWGILGTPHCRESSCNHIVVLFNSHALFFCTFVLQTALRNLANA